MPNRVQITDNTKKVAEKATRGKGPIKSLARAGAYIRGIAQRSIAKRQTSAPPGHPPHTRTGSLKRAIAFDVDKNIGNVIIGPKASWIATIGSTHEFGKTETKAKKTLMNNWDIRPGGSGPIDFALAGFFSGKGGLPKFQRLRMIKIRTQKQADRIRRNLESEIRGPGFKAEVGDDGRLRFAVFGPRKYPEREFMTPALEVAKERLPEFWKNSITGRG